MEVNNKKPDTIKPSSLKEKIRIQFLYTYLKAIPKNQSSLDLACGYGFSFKLNPSFYGVELDESAYHFCKQQGFRVKQGSILEPLPFEDSFFDNVFSHDVLEHFELEEITPIFRNVWRVLKPGGRFLNIVPNKKGYDYGLRINAGHKHFVTVEEIASVAKNTGFRLIEHYPSPFPRPFDKLFTHNKIVTICEKSR